jgi:deoxyribonuclease V
VDVRALIGEQKTLAEKAILNDSFGIIRRIGGVDCAYIGDQYIIAGLVVIDRDTLQTVYRTFHVQKLDFPYIPGLLAYREAPAMTGAVEKAKIKPDLLMVDGFGVNHPRRCGIACHLGVRLDMPAIGVGKSFLCGNIRGDNIFQDDEKTGMLVYGQNAKKPVYVSAGHRISLETAANLVSECFIKGKLPEPTRLAHEYVTMLKPGLAQRFHYTRKSGI